MRVRVPGGVAHLPPDRHAEHPTWTWCAGYGFAFDAPTPRPPVDERRKERR